MIHILYNALHLTGQFSGVQNVTEQLMKEAFIHPVHGICLEALCPQNYRLNLPVTASQKLTNLNIDTSNRWKRIGYEHFYMQRHVKEQSPLILHCPAYIRPWHWKGLNVITIHDIIALDYPEYCSTANRLYFNLLLSHSIINASKIIAVSHTVKNDILKRFDLSPDKIEVIYPGINPIFHIIPTKQKLNEVRIRYQLPSKFILYVGNIEPKKNIARVMDSFENLINKYDIPHKLVIAGRFAWKYQDICKKIRHKNTKRILFPGYIPTADLPSLYTLADLFVFPSLYEGFGIPPLESMACGTPVIVSNKGALPEITNGCALITDPYSVDSITEAMIGLIQNQALRNRLTQKGKQHTSQFTWNRTWQCTTNLYRSLVNS